MSKQQPNVINYKKLGDFILTAPKKNPQGKLAAYLNIPSIKDKFFIELEYLISPHGAGTYNPNGTTPKDELNYTISLQEKGGNNVSNEDVERLFNTLRALDEKMINYGIEHSQVLYGKKYENGNESHKLLVNALYDPFRLVKKSTGKDGTVYPDKFDIKFTRKEDKSPDVLIYTNSSTPIEPKSFEEIEALIPRGTTVKAVVQPSLYFIPGGKYGIRFRIIQLKIPNNTQKYGKPLTYAFSDPIEESSNNDSNGKNVELTDNEKNKASSNDEVSNDEAYDSEVDVGDEDV